MHTKVTEYCHNCGSDIPEGAKVSVDDLGPFINCPKCGGSQDIDTTRDRDGGEGVN